MPVLLLALDRGASLVLTGEDASVEAEPCVLGRGSQTRLKRRQLSRRAAVAVVQQRAGQAAAVSVTAGREAVAVVRHGSSPTSFQLLLAGESTVLQDGDSLYLLPSSQQLRYGYRVLSLPADGGGGGGSRGAAVVQVAPTRQLAKEASHVATVSAAETATAAEADPAALQGAAAAAAAAAATEAREARAAAAAAAEARVAAAAARHTSRGVAAVNRARQANVVAVDSPPAEPLAVQQAGPSTAAAAAAAAARGAGSEVVDLTLSDSDEEPQPASPAAKQPRLAAASPAAGVQAAASLAATAGAGAGAAAAEAGGAPAAAGAAMPVASGSGDGQDQPGLTGSVALGCTALAEDTAEADSDGEGLLMWRRRGSHAAEAQQAHQQRIGAPQPAAPPAGGPTTLRQLRLLQLKMDLVEAWEYLLRFSFEGPLAAQRIQPGQLAAALAALRRPHVPRPLPDPAEQHSFSVLSYNVWFENVCAMQRMAAIGRLIEQTPLRLPDFVLLQEMAHAFYLQFAAMPWWHAYHATPMPPAPPFGEHYFTTILWRRDSLAAAQCHPPRRFKQTCMGRDLKAVSGSLGGAPLRVCTTHLESPLGGRSRQHMWPERRAQMEEMLPLLDGSPEPNCLVAGDVNWIHVNGVDEPVALPPGWVDVWTHLRPEDPGWTYDTVVCYQKGRKYGRGSRMDRIFCRLADWEPLAIEMVGREPIPGLTRTVRLGKTARSDKTIPVWPSDHFGLFAVFMRKQLGSS